MNGDAIVCAGCGTALPLPTTEQAAEGWLRHSMTWYGRTFFAYTCPACPETAGRAVLEARRR